MLRASAGPQRAKASRPGRAPSATVPSRNGAGARGLVVLLAHHRRDQAETFLLQAMRGAGAAGLAGMPAKVVRDGIAWARPWLSRPREAIEAYVTRHRIKCVDDDSNHELRFARNRLRPRSGRRWSAHSRTPRRHWQSVPSARRRRWSASGVGAQDWRDGCWLGGLNVRAWLALSCSAEQRAARLVETQRGRRAGSLVTRLLAELRPVGNARWPPQGAAALYRGLALWPAVIATAAPTCWFPSATPPAIGTVGRGPGRIPTARVGWPPAGYGCGRTRCATGLAGPSGVNRGGAEVSGRPRRPPRSLKKQYQDHGVPA